MDIHTNKTTTNQAPLNESLHASEIPVEANSATQYRVIRRNGKLTSFDQSKITIAITKAFLAVEGNHAAASSRIHDTTAKLSTQVVEAVTRRLPGGGTVHIEDIQDQVELALMRSEHHQIARAYVLYREAHAKQRADHIPESEISENSIFVTTIDGSKKRLDQAQLSLLIEESCKDLTDVDSAPILKETLKNLFDGVSEQDINQAMVMSARTLIEREPNYSYVAARLLLDKMRKEALNFLHISAEVNTHADMAQQYADYFPTYISRGIELQLLEPRLVEYDLPKLAAALMPERDLQFNYLGLQTLYDRYFQHWDNVRFELPQAFFMRVAMGLAINEIDRETRAIEFYQLLSSFDFMSSTPTLFNAATLRPQLSSCYLTTVPDDLDGIYSAMKDNALLSKFAGGLGNDWTPVRALGAHIKGTNGQSQGVVPFLKVANDTAVAVNQCLAPDTLLWTAKGPKAIKNIKIGDLVLGKQGYYREVKKHLKYNQTDPMVEISARHATLPIKITAGHPVWSCQIKYKHHTPKQIVALLEKGEMKIGYCEAGDLKQGDFVAQTIPKETIPVNNFSEDDARFYGIMLGDGHITKGEYEWGISINPTKDTFFKFIKTYLTSKGIHYWINQRNEHYLQIKWSSGLGLLRDATTGQFVGGNEFALPFTKDDFYNESKEKHIAPRFMHLPIKQTKSLIRGLIETDGSISDGKLINFTNTSSSLIEGLRYALLRLKIPSSASYRERDASHIGHRVDGTEINFSGVTKSYDLRIPCVPDFSEYFDYRIAKKRYWFEWNGCLFTRITKIKDIDPVPFVFDLKVEGDHSYTTNAFAISNGGKRKGAVCAYLETWHLDIEEFLDLRKNTGDDRRRTHDMNTANWIPDLFMKRVFEDKEWTLFSPEETPDLHDLYGAEFEARYCHYENLADQGQMKLYKRISAVTLWRKMLTLLFETGHPWVTFKDPCNLRSPQQHQGVVHSSNLCTEITLNTSEKEIAVCNLGSINLAAHVTEAGLDTAKLARTIRTAMRMLDNVIDINYYSVPQARNSNLRHRPVGLGIMGFQDALFKLRLPYNSQAASDFADQSMETISYYTIFASSELAEERGSYSTFEGSLWSQGILPYDSIELVAKTRGDYLNVDQSYTLDWDTLRQRVQTVGMRNSNCMAIAPTATISNICGVSQSIEPVYQNLFVKSNLSGEFTCVNPYLVADLKARDLWDPVMVNDLKYFDGSIQSIDRIPDDIKQIYTCAFEIDAKDLIEVASRRQKWIDQAQSLNLYMAEPSGQKLDELYRLAWLKGLKTTYYLRSIGATAAEKTSVDDEPKICSIDNPDCEACQ